MSVTLVLGGGLLGTALSRIVGPCVVASRTPRPHAGLWRHHDLGQGDPARLLALQPRRVIVALGPLSAPDVAHLTTLLRVFERAGMPTLTLLAREVGPLPGRTVVVAPLFGLGDRCIAPLLPALRAGKRAVLPRAIPRCRPLHVEDAARAALALADAPGESPSRLVGPTEEDARSLAAALTARFGPPVGAAWTRSLSAEERDALATSASGGDLWDDARFGPRRSFTDWVERLPGPRPRR